MGCAWVEGGGWCSEIGGRLVVAIEYNLRVEGYEFVIWGICNKIRKRN